jgi:hypothetical protein
MFTLKLFEQRTGYYRRTKRLLCASREVSISISLAAIRRLSYYSWIWRRWRSDRISNKSTYFLPNAAGLLFILKRLFTNAISKQRSDWMWNGGVVDPVSNYYFTYTFLCHINRTTSHYIVKCKNNIQPTRSSFVSDWTVLDKIRISGSISMNEDEPT